MTTPVDARDVWLLSPRERDSVTGDSLEEYRDVIVPSGVRWRGHLWYFGHALSV
jgi:hypothetical protein